MFSQNKTTVKTYRPIYVSIDFAEIKSVFYSITYYYRSLQYEHLKFLDCFINYLAIKKNSDDTINFGF